MIEIKFKGQPLHVKGPLLAVGSQAPSFELVDQDLKVVTLESLGHKKKILNIFISLDTPVCAQSILSFEDHARKLSDLVILDISMDLPFAASRFCKGHELGRAMTLSAFRSSFPKDYGIRIEDGPMRGLCARAVVVLGEDNRILYNELVPEITQEPDYKAALRAL